MRVIAIKTLREFWRAHPDAEQPLRAWYDEASKANGSRPMDIRPIRTESDHAAALEEIAALMASDPKLGKPKGTSST